MKRPEFTDTATQRAYIREEWQNFRTTLAVSEPAPTARTWGFEIETPDADSVYGNAVSVLYADYREALTADPNAERRTLESVLNFVADGSVEGENTREECECDCDSCRYHDCDCDDCENRNTDPDHDCGSSECYGTGQYQEITSLGGLDTTHPEALTLLDRAHLKDAEVNDTCGLHIHLGSADLSPVQVANVISAYRATSDLLGWIAGRSDTHYARRNEDTHRAEVMRERSTGKYYAVNTDPHFSTYRSAKTIEFRQHAGTNDTAEVRAWAVLLIALVEYAKAGKPVYWLARCRTLAELRHELGV